MDRKPMRRCLSTRPGETGMDVTSRCTLGDPNKLPEGVPQPARMPYVSDKHPRQTLEVINLLRKHRELCDVVLVVGAKKIYAHRVILSACSPYFRAMFTGELAESRQTEVVIRDIDERAMELLIDFSYTSQITVEEGNVQTLLPAACLLQLAEIQEACCEFLKRQLDPSNCLGIRAFADTHSCRELLRIADKFTQHNFQEVRGWKMFTTKSQGFKPDKVSQLLCNRGYLYAVGGQDGVSCLNIVERYDPKENKWTRVASMSTRRLGVAVAVLGGFLYAVGGSDGTSPLNTVERYNPQENRWHTIAPMGTRRKHLGCAVYQDMIYAVGGRDDTTELSSAERYNPRTNQWSPVVAMTSRRSGVGLAVVNGQLMAVGGFDGTTYLKTIEVFDPDANTWRLYGGMNYRRLGGGVGVIKMTHCESHIW
ncbi:kelch-like protein 20 [Pyxicephalus adspersus]|uniref:kelch-like protein 20 n=1 Tax=Pyxicephalus adspersus TaxID=30357 RepID=UPI003B59B227